MATVAILPGAVQIQFYPRDHDPPHFHARQGGDDLVVRIADLAVLHGILRRGDIRDVLDWARRHQAELALNWILSRAGLEVRMITFP